MKQHEVYCVPRKRQTDGQICRQTKMLLSLYREYETTKKIGKN